MYGANNAGAATLAATGIGAASMGLSILAVVLIAVGLLVDRGVFNQLETRLRERWGLQTAV